MGSMPVRRAKYLVFLMVFAAFMVAATQIDPFACARDSGGGAGNDGTGSPPNATAGFSSGTWGGSPAPNAAYRFGIVDASTASGWCTYPAALNPYFIGGVNALNSPRFYAAFWFLTSNKYAFNNCGLNVTPSQWGAMQASHFDQALDASGKCCFDIVVADIEVVAGDIGEWKSDTQANNKDLIGSFFTTLCGVYFRCGHGAYSTQSHWIQIVGSNPGHLGTTQFWLASYGPSQSQLDTQQDYFTVSPGGYAIYSWQYTDDACSSGCTALIPPGGGACYDTHINAKALADGTSPPIPRFDKWTNSRPDQACGVTQ